MPAKAIQEDRRWRRTATPEQLRFADDLLALWYREKDEAAAFKERMTALMAERYLDRGPLSSV